ncbi:MAG: ubiquinol-cytochrome c reductase iron-sulfur subunit [Acidimicrobiales bacterium]
MSPVIVVAIVALVVLAGVGVIASARRRDTDLAVGELSRETRTRDRKKPAPLEDQTPEGGRSYEAAARQEPSKEIEPAESAAPVEWTPPDPELVGVSRRQFFNRSIVAFMGLGITGFGTAVVTFLWPGETEGFGASINLGRVDEVKQSVRDGNGFFYVPEGRLWVTEFPAEALPQAEQVYSAPELAGMQAGLIALWQTCPHLGCRVPECVPSQWFECGCHGSQYNRVGEYKAGPAPRGMDRFVMEVDDRNNFIVDTGTIIPGPPKGTNTTGQEAEGPNCVSDAAGH